MSVNIRRKSGGYVLTTRVRIRRGIEEVFAFFSDAGNLDRLTPGRLRFEIVTPLPIEMKRGTLLDYRLRVRGFPVRWRSEISVWEPPYRFVDEQRRGPYKRWHHEHTFAEERGVTTMIDTVRYAVPGGLLVHALLVGPDLRSIFEYRERELLRAFDGMGAAQQ